VKCWAALILALLAARVGAATAYVSDELVLGVYAEQNSQGQRLATLHSGANVETLGVSGDFTQVRLNDGTVGWVKSAYLTTQMPATVRVKQLEEELDRSRATTPALAEAAARSEALQLKRELNAVQSELDAARAAAASPAPAGPASADPARGAAEGAPAEGTPTASVPVAPSGIPGVLAAISSHGRTWTAVSLVLMLACGYWLGYGTLARRIKRKFGGIKVY
jgi:cell division septation protein DedD